MPTYCVRRNWPFLPKQEEYRQFWTVMVIFGRKSVCFWTNLHYFELVLFISLFFFSALNDSIYHKKPRKNTPKKDSKMEKERAQNVGNATTKRCQKWSQCDHKMTSKETPEGPQNDLIQPLKIPKIAQKEGEAHRNDLKGLKTTPKYCEKDAKWCRNDPKLAAFLAPK